MLDEGYIREPRDLALCKAALNQSNAQGLLRAARHNILKPLSLWSEGSALHDLELQLLDRAVRQARHCGALPLVGDSG